MFSNRNGFVLENMDCFDGHATTRFTATGILERVRTKFKERREKITPTALGFSPIRLIYSNQIWKIFDIRFEYMYIYIHKYLIATVDFFSIGRNGKRLGKFSTVQNRKNSKARRIGNPKYFPRKISVAAARGYTKKKLFSHKQSFVD